jgi:hypothetical protein
MDPTLNDVLSGRGSWFNQHPGNKHFRKIIEEQEAEYMTGTKKQKMDISKAIVEAIHSKEPAGRFLKRCPETSQWKELSKRDAADKAAQAMAYAVNGESMKQKRRERRMRSLLPLSSSKASAAPTQISDSDRPTQDHLEGSSSVAQRGLAAREVAGTNNAESASYGETGNSNVPQQLLPHLQQFSSTTLRTTSGAPLAANQLGLVEVLAQAVQQQRQHYQQQQLLLQLNLGQHPLGIHLLPPASPLEGLAQLWTQAQHQQQQQQLILLQRLYGQNSLGVLNHVPSAASIPLLPPFSTPPLALPNEILHHGTYLNVSLTGPQLALSHALHNQSYPTQQAQQMGSLLRQQQQLLASSLAVSNQALFQQQALPPIVAHPSTNAVGEGGDEVQSGSEDEQAKARPYKQV